MHTLQGMSQSRKQAELRSATQTYTAFENQTIKLSQWSRGVKKTIEYFLSGSSYESDKRKSTVITE